ncbi:flagellar biosynthesis protein FlhF [Nitrosospira multiformis]|uniref:flagellar biosynthesis protein FlhF n=1 Tax=Nitrosospira multiformis TaxID=1231 RepID=UPI0008951348|nr:flagellar biosynthesis protein FlhF [Nitrosospira multiformis]SDZ82992.1 flagellar biosynthesis protein FlhF [Nitrosospira multiformis]
MTIKRFFAKTTSEALRMVRDELGADGVILSNRAVDNGVEILALSNSAMSALLPPAECQKEDGQEQRLREESKNGFSPDVSVAILPVPKPVVPKSMPENPAVPPARGAEQTARTARIEKNAEDAPERDLTPLPRKKAQETDHAARTNKKAVPQISSKPRRATTGRVQSTKSGEGSAKKSSRGTTPRESSAMAGETRVSDFRSWRKRLQNTRNSSPAMNPEIAISRRPRRLALDSLQVADKVAASVLKEVRFMHSTLEQQLASLSRNEQERRDPVRGQLFRQLLAAGLHDASVQALLDQLPEKLDASAAMNWVRTALTGNLQTIGNEDEILEKGGVYALVGPTGVGKTTTTAKLAARCVVRHGASKVALLTTDSYRIGGHEQLRIYGKILGVSIHAVRDTQDLALVLNELRGKHIVLIDTVGVGQRDQMVAEQVAMLSGCGSEIKRLLLLNAASSWHTLDEVAEAYWGDGLAGAIISKLDEAVVTGCALDIAMRHNLPLYYVANGQRVPEDIELADAESLVNRMFDDLSQFAHFPQFQDAASFTALHHSCSIAGASREDGGIGPDTSEVFLD